MQKAGAGSAPCLFLLIHEPLSLFWVMSLYPTPLSFVLPLAMATHKRFRFARAGMIGDLSALLRGM
jgi:hypothetical protein